MNFLKYPSSNQQCNIHTVDIYFSNIHVLVYYVRIMSYNRRLYVMKTGQNFYVGEFFSFFCILLLPLISRYQANQDLRMNFLSSSKVSFATYGSFICSEFFSSATLPENFRIIASYNGIKI